MTLKLPIYMDYHATTPVDPRVLEAMMPFFSEKFGNAASVTHVFGWEAQEAVEKARAEIAAAIGAEPKEIIFTSGATEADNLAIKGAAYAMKHKGDHIVTSVIEHRAVLDSCRRLEKEGFRVTYLPVDKMGQVDPMAVEEAITDKTILVTIMYANNEIGVLQPVKEIGAICRQKGIVFHSDAVQAVGKIPARVDDLNVDFMSLTAHKMYGPKGVGALYVRMTKPRVKLVPLVDGGGHERGRRSGTLAVPGIVGFGAACAKSERVMDEEGKRLIALRERLKKGIFERLDHVTLNGHPEKRLPGNCNISFEFAEGESLLMAMKEVAVSSGSACTSATLEPSYVLMALGVGEELAHSSIRFGLGRGNTEEEVDFVVEKVVERVKRLREMSPLYAMAVQGMDPKSARWSGH